MLLNKIIANLIIIFIGLFVLNSCGNSVYMTTTDLNYNVPGVEYNLTEFSKRDPILTFELNGNEKYVIKVYVYKKLEESYDFYFFTKNLYDYCAAVFINDMLYYWGYVDDFKKEDESLIQMIGEMISEKLIKK